MITQQLMYFHKNIRLNDTSYTGKRTYFVTQCCHERRRYFADPVRCEWLLRHVREISTAHSFAILAYCIMPNHIHLLVDGLLPTSDFPAFHEDPQDQNKPRIRIGERHVIVAEEILRPHPAS